MTHWRAHHQGVPCPGFRFFFRWGSIVILGCAAFTLMLFLTTMVWASEKCHPAITWNDGSVSFDRKCMYRLGPGWVHIANPYQVWAFKQMPHPTDPYFKPGAGFDEAFGKFAVALMGCAWMGDPKDRPGIDKCIDAMQHMVTDDAH